MAQSYLVRRGGGKNAGKTLEKILTDITYTGQMQSMLKVMDDTLYALLILESSGTLTVNGNYTGDVWLCGGGGSGGPTYDVGSYSYEPGGGGGYTTNVSNVAIISGEVVIGAGGTASAGGITSYLTYTANGGETGQSNGNGGNGGSGGGSTRTAGGKGQGTTTRPFASQDMEPQCGGGASAVGGGYASANGGADGSDGELGRNTTIAWTGIGGYRGGRYSTGRHVSQRNYMNGIGYGGGGAGGSSSTSLTGSDHGSPGAVMIRIAI